MIQEQQTNQQEEASVRYQTVIITGCNSGIGLEALRQLLIEEWNSNKKTKHFIMACRGVDLSNSEMDQLVSEYLKDYPNRKESELKSHFTALKLDLGSFLSIQEFVNEIKKLIQDSRIPPLHSLICNAGLQLVNKRVLTEEGYEVSFGVNHLGHFLLINLLLPLFIKSNLKNRIIIVSSDTHDRTKSTGMPHPRFESAEKMAHCTPESNENIGSFGRIRYTTSKFCNVLCAYELVRRLQSHELYKNQFTVNLFNPGFVPTTGLSRDYNKFMRFIARNVLSLLSYVHSGVRSLKVSGGDLKRLLLDPNLEESNGKYFDGNKQTDSSPDTHNTQTQKEFWDDSVQLIINRSTTITLSDFL